MKSILFITSELDGLSIDMLNLVLKEASSKGISIITYVGSSFHDTDGNLTLESQIYNYINKDIISGIILNGGAVGQFSPQLYLEEFVKQFSPIPVVSLSFPIKNTSSILVDNYRGIYNLIDHLIKTHSYTKIGFVKGPDGHPEAEERLKAYKDALSSNNIKIDDNFMASGDFSEEAGMAAVEAFLRFDDNIQAIACVDDDSALGVYKALKSRGKKIPSDVAVCGFDDIELAQNLIPSLTTVTQPYREMIKEALKQIEINSNKDITIPTISTIRESCGCIDRDIESITNKIDPVTDFGKSKELFTLSGTLIPEKWKVKLISSLENDLGNLDSSNFIDVLETLLEEHEIISDFHKLITHLDSITPLNTRSNSVFHKARVLINKISNKQDSLRLLEYQESTNRLNRLISEISKANSYKNLSNLLTSTLKELNVTEYYIITLHKNEADLIYSIGKEINLSNKSFNPKSLLPDNNLSSISNKNLLLTPITADGKMIGYIVSSLTNETSNIFKILNSQVGSVIHRLTIQSERDIEQNQIETKNVNIQKLIGPMLELIKDVTNESRSEIQEMENINKAVSISNTNLTQTIKMLREITLKINSVESSVKKISDISENVNVLAINTSIQSAHAGIYGKAFSVIAKEIRKLSDSTAINTKTISVELADTVKQFNEFKELNDNTVDTFNKFSDNINHFMSTFSNIADKMNSLSSSSLNIIDIMES